MSLLTPDQIAQLASNGLSPENDHKPVVLLQAKHDGEVLMQFLLTHVDPEHPNQAYGLIDFGHGKPRLSMVFVPQLESHDPRYDLEIEQDADFQPQCLISVYAEAARQVGRITTSQAALQWAATQLDLTKARAEFSKPLLNPDGTAFLPFSSN